MESPLYTTAEAEGNLADMDGTVTMKWECQCYVNLAKRLVNCIKITFYMDPFYMKTFNDINSECC